MEVFHLFLTQYGPTLISAALTAVMGYLGMVAKRLYETYVNDREKQQIVSTCVKAVEQIYRDLGGEEKLGKAISAATEMLSERGIKIGELELRMLIESAVAEYKAAFQTTDS